MSNNLARKKIRNGVERLTTGDTPGSQFQQENEAAQKWYFFGGTPVANLINAP